MDEQDTPPRGYRVPREYRKGSRYAEQQPPPSPSPVGPPPSAGGAGPVGWIRRWPIAALGAVAVLALALGAVVGVAARQGAVDEQKDRADRVQHELETVAGDRDTMRRRAEDAEGEVVDLHDQVKKLSARGEVPSFVGDFVDDVESSDAVEAYNWKVKTKSQISEKEPGTVLSQSPKEGTTLKAGRSITLVVAKKAPPKPKQWVTIKTFSGGSSTQTDEFKIPEGARARLSYNMPGDANNIIELYEAGDSSLPTDLLLNEIGPQSGTTRIYGAGTYYLDVTGAYTIEVQVFKRP